MELVNDQPDHAVNVARRCQPRRETPRDAELCPQIGELARRGHLLGQFVGALAVQRLGAPLALTAPGGRAG